MDDTYCRGIEPHPSDRNYIVGGDITLMPAQTAKQARNLAAIALLISLAGNFGIAHQATRSCNQIEEVKNQIHATLGDQLFRLETGRLDEDYRHFYGSAWVERKQEAIDRLRIQVKRFDGNTCTLFFRR